LEQLLTIEILGQLYKFRTASKGVIAEAVAHLLENEVSKIENQHKEQTNQMNKIAILLSAAMNIAYENIELKQKYANLVSDLTFRTSRLIHELDNRMS